MKKITENIPLIIIVFSTIISVFGGINQVWGLFNKINIAGVIISVAAAVILIVYVPHALQESPLKISIEQRFGIKVRTFSLFVALFVLCAGTIPFIIQYWMASSYFSKGEQATIEGSAAEAQYYWTKTSDIYDKLGFKEKSIHSNLLLAEAYYDMGKTKEANEILSSFEKSPDLTLKNQATLYAVMGNMNEAMGNYTQAEINYQQALQTAEPNSYTAATILMNKAVILSEKGPDYMEQYFRLANEAKQIYESKKDYNGIAQVYINLAAFIEYSPEKSLAYLDSAETYANKVSSSKTEGQILVNKGLLLKRQGSLESAEKCYKEAQQKYESIGYIIGQAEIQTKLAYIDISRSHFGSALQKIKESMAWVKQISKEDNKVNYILLAKLYSTQAEVLESCGDMAESNKQFKAAIDILNEHRSYINEVNTKLNYAAFLQRQNKNEEAYPLLEEIHSLIMVDYQNKNSQTVLVATNNLGKRFQDAGQLGKATELYKKAIDMAITIKDRKYEAESKENLAIVYRWQNLPDWQGYILEALQIYRQLNNKSDELQCLFNIYTSTGDVSKLGEILNLLDQSSIEDNIRTNVILGITIIDLKDPNLLREHMVRLEALEKRLIKNDNAMLIGKCNLKLAQVQQQLGNQDKIEQHFEAIEKSLKLFPYPQNIGMYSDLAFLKLGIGKTQPGIVNIFEAFDAASGIIQQQTMMLKIVKLYWPEIEQADRSKYIKKLKTLYNNGGNADYKAMLDNFFEQVGV